MNEAALHIHQQRLAIGREQGVAAIAELRIVVNQAIPVVLRARHGQFAGKGCPDSLLRREWLGNQGPV